ncbi:MAG: glycerol-3-phosphate dehydrogenase/oxidase [Deltaproteobacteria bacterium]|nr:glycerol-3-phosphate dehydrogenase/oxidase [Deltaproteobacteria bacterium]
MDAATTEESTASSPDAARRATLDRAAREGVDVVVVGGGITGAGIARDAALRGLRVLVVDKGDWASGTSSKSAKLVHGGLRYLERFQLGLVFESTRERWRLQRDNPNLVWPLDFLMPVYAGDKHGLLKLDLGLWLYDLLALFRGHARHRRVKPAAAEARAPGLSGAGLEGALVFRDCGTNDARLVLANVLDAARHGALCASHTRLERLEYAGDGADRRVTAAIVRDLLHDRELVVPTRHVCHAMGHWSDDAATPARDGRLMRPTKGVHVVVPRARLPVTCALAVTSPVDQRANFIVPAGDTTYIGTTDTDYDGDPDDVRADDADIAYLFATVARYFPDARLTRADITSTWAGLRPLLRDDAASAYRTSREHEVFVDPRGLTTIAGGKLTTYRAMAEEATDAVARDLRRFEIRATRCSTANRPLDPGLPAAPDGAASPLARALWALHGSAMTWVEARLRTHPEEAERLDDAPLTVLAQVSLAVLREQAYRLEDVLVRRTLLYLQGRDQGLAAAPRVARHMARLLDRDDAWVAAEVAAYEALCAASRTGHTAAGPLAEPAR